MPEYINICLNLSLLANLIRPFLQRLGMYDYLFSKFSSKCIRISYADVSDYSKDVKTSGVSKDVRSQYSKMKCVFFC